jgi:hypothetical protein
MPPEDNIISYEEWEDRYVPFLEPMFDFIEDALDYVSNLPDPVKHIWTVVDNNPNSVYLDVLPGIRVFNRLGFYVTTEEWDDLEMVVSNDKSYS